MEPSGGMRTLSLPEGSRSRASRSASPVIEKAREMTAISGRRCLELFGRFVPAGSWAKTFSELLIGRRDWFSSRCVLTWKMRATKSNRLYFQLVVSMPHTKGIEYGLLPTAQTQGLKICVKGKTVFMPLGFMPTPTALDCGSGRMPRRHRRTPRRHRGDRPRAGRERRVLRHELEPLRRGRRGERMGLRGELRPARHLCRRGRADHQRLLRCAT